MADIFSTLGLKGVPELFMLSTEDLDRYKGEKSVIAILAPDRTHPEFKNAEQTFAALEDKDDLVITIEDHPDGPLHERLRCGPKEFCFALIDKAGNTVMRGDHIPSLQSVREHLQERNMGTPAH
ncbi:DUF4174 domain-containing protein [Oligoflexus tunisiensis]|uniref:DUF4174 domain-containing protein n=1 Tax=Oligoflexus tunisiensis TaxID=708132 RepID=UPI00114CEC7F|nr:DUF4174 domain-containing protein [Oligoflexus tunisiensis]